MSIYIVGIKNLDNEFERMMKVKLACENANIEYPQEVVDYFKDPTHNEEYLRYVMQETCIRGAVSSYRKKIHKGSITGFIINLSLLPEDVKSIRVENTHMDNKF